MAGRGVGVSRGPRSSLGPPPPRGPRLWGGSGHQGAHPGLPGALHQPVDLSPLRARTSTAVYQTASAGPSASRVGVSGAPSPPPHSSKWYGTPEEFPVQGWG